MENKKSKGTMALVILLLIVTIASLVLATYAWAKYTSEVGTGEATAVVAKWNVTGNSSGALTWSETYTNVVTNRLAPGTSGKMPITFSVNDTEVEVKYTITLTGYTNKPTNLKLYGCSTTGAKNATALTLTEAKTASNVNVVVATGTIKPGGADFSGYIYYDWPFESEGANADALDTADGNLAASGTADMSLTIKIDAEQVQPAKS